jgi:hypothetical protein
MTREEYKEWLREIIANKGKCTDRCKKSDCPIKKFRGFANATCYATVDELSKDSTTPGSMDEKAVLVAEEILLDFLIEDIITDNIQ